MGLTAAETVLATFSMKSGSHLWILGKMSGRIEFLKDGRWDELNARAASGLRDAGFDLAGQSVQTFLGHSHALLSLVTSLRRLYPNRNIVGIEAGASPRFTKLSYFLATEGFEVLWLSHAQMNEPTPWLEKVSRSLLAVFSVYDHPIFDTIFDMSKVAQEATARRFFLVRMMHAPQGLSHLGRLQPNEIALHGVRPGLTLAVAGERYRCRPLECEFLAWENLTLDMQRLRVQDEAKAVIEKFESSLPTGFSVLKRKTDRPRIFHRSMIVSEEVEGSALCELVAQKLGLSLAEPGVETALETTSLLRWQDSRLDDWLGESGLTPMQRRGLLSIDATLLNSKFEAALAESLSELRELQHS